MYMENLYSDDMDFEILARENALEIDIIQHAIMEDFNIYTETCMFESAESEDKSDGILTKIVDNMKKAIKKIIEFVQGIFTSMKMGVGDQLSVSDYMKSDTAKIRLTNYALAIQKELEDEILEGRKLVKAISSKAGFDPHIVASFVDKAQNFVMDQGTTILSTGAAVVLANKISNSILNGNKLLKKNQELAEQIEAEKKKQSDIKTDKLKNDGHSKLAALNSLNNVISSTMRKATGVWSSLNRELDKYKVTKNDREKRKRR